MSAAKSRAESVTRQSQMVNGGLESLVKGRIHAFQDSSRAVANGDAYDAVAVHIKEGQNTRHLGK